MPRKGSTTKRWVVTASLGEFARVKRKLRQSGFDVAEAFDQIGSIIGTGNAAIVRKVRAIPGVMDVSPEPPPIKIAPPNATIT